MKDFKRFSENFYDLNQLYILNASCRNALTHAIREKLRHRNTKRLIIDQSKIELAIFFHFDAVKKFVFNSKMLSFFSKYLLEIFFLIRTCIISFERSHKIFSTNLCMQNEDVIFNGKIFGVLKYENILLMKKLSHQLREISMIHFYILSHFKMWWVETIWERKVKINFQSWQTTLTLETFFFFSVSEILTQAINLPTYLIFETAPVWYVCLIFEECFNSADAQLCKLSHFCPIILKSKKWLF